MPDKSASDPFSDTLGEPTLADFAVPADRSGEASQKRRSRWSMLRRIAAWQRAARLLIYVVGLPSGLLTAYSAGLALWPELEGYTPYYTPGVAATMVNVGARPIYNVSASCALVYDENTLNEESIKPVTGDKIVPTVGPGMYISAVPKACTQLTPATTGVPYLFVEEACYRSALPWFRGLSYFVFKYDAMTKGYAPIDSNSDEAARLVVSNYLKACRLQLTGWP